jgi:hypothetical protein
MRPSLLALQSFMFSSGGFLIGKII